MQVMKSSEELGSLKFAGKLYQGHGPLPRVEEELDHVEEGEGEGRVRRRSGEEGRLRRKSGEERRKSRRGSLDDNIGGEDIACHHRTKNAQVGVKMSR